MSFRSAAALVAAVVVVSVLGGWGGAWWARWQEERKKDARDELIEAGEASRLRAGDAFPSMALVDLAGNPAASDTLAGPAGALVLCLVSNCDPCRDYVEMWICLAPELPEGVRLYALTYERPLEFAPYAEEIGIDFPALCDTARVLHDTYQLELYPTVVGLAPDGRIAFIRHGLDEDFTPPEAAALLQVRGAAAGTAAL